MLLWFVSGVVGFGGSVVEVFGKSFVVRSEMIDYVRRLKVRSERNGEVLFVRVRDNRGNVKDFKFDDEGKNY